MRGLLSPREEDVLRLTAQGFSNKKVAAQLKISTRSIETYKSRAVEKLNLHTQAEIVRYGIGLGWLDEWTDLKRHASPSLTFIPPTIPTSTGF